MPKTATLNTAPVFDTLTKTAVHTLNVYGDSDPTGYDILHGLTRMAEMLQIMCGLDETAMDGFNKAIAETKASAQPADVPPVTAEDLQHTQTVLTDFIGGLEPDEMDLDKMKAALEYLTDFYAESEAAVN